MSRLKDLNDQRQQILSKMHEYNAKNPSCVYWDYIKEEHPKYFLLRDELAEVKKEIGSFVREFMKNHPEIKTSEEIGQALMEEAGIETS